MTDTTELPTEAQQFTQKQADEYGRYRAIAPIDHDGARAYNVGHPVPASNVEKYGYLEQGLVEEVRDDDEPRLAVSGEPGAEPRLALSGEPGGDVLPVGTGNPDDPTLDLTKEH